MSEPAGNPDRAGRGHDDREVGSSDKGTKRELRGMLPEVQQVRITEDHIQSLLHARRGREDLFGRQLFSDPAWDILLELYAAMLGKRRMSLRELSLAIGAAETIVARWVAAMREAGVIKAADAIGHDPEQHVELTDDAAAKMTMLADRWSSAFVTI